MLLVMVISGHHIHLVGNGVFDAGPIDVENPVSKTGGTERRIADIRVVECLTAQAQEVSSDIVKGVLGVLRAEYPIFSKPAYNFRGPFVYLASSITALLSEIVAVST